MANSIPIRFTEEKYATKNEVIKELKTPLIDKFWYDITLYRQNFMRPLSLKALNGENLRYCGTVSLNSELSKSEAKLIKLFSRYTKLDFKNGDQKIFDNKCDIESLSYVAKFYGLDVDEPYLRSVLNDKIYNVEGKYKDLLHYSNALKEGLRIYASPIDEDFLANIYMKISGNDELTSFYRTNKIGSNEPIIGKLYDSAPAELIESAMNGLFAFLAGDNVSALIKSFVSYYFINYIKPFDDFNNEISLITMKAILSHSDIDELAIHIPLEILLVEDNDNIGRIFAEVQKNNDTTYFVDLGLKILNLKLDEMLSLINNLEVTSLKQDYYHDDRVEAGIISLFEDEIKIETNNKQEVPQKEIKQDINKSIDKSSDDNELAISIDLPSLDEKAASRLEEDLLESDPELKRGQAYFYARHCTMKKRYTIRQYQKELGCAYETARTSMDSLVKLGYYRQEMVKNKKVYTPILKK
jgi:Fic family protein